MDTFSLKPNDSVYIYGAGEWGRTIYKRIKHIYNVNGFIDKNITENNEIDLKIYSIEECSIIKDGVVIVCVHNAVVHDEIERDLLAKGIKKILRLVTDSSNYDFYKLMNINYNYLLEEKYDKLSAIPLSTNKNNICNHTIIELQDKYVICWLPLDIMYVGAWDEKKTGTIYEKTRYWADCAIVQFDAYIELFKFFMWGEGTPGHYVELMKNINNSYDMSDEKFLQSQYEICNRLEQNFYLGIESQRLAPIEVKWNKRGHFNVVDGHHRWVFYYLKGFKRFVVRMTKGDYELWEKKKLVEHEELLYKNDIIQRGRVVNPFFYNESCSIKCDYLFVESLQRYIYLNNRIYKNLIEIGNTTGYYSWLLYQMRRVKRPCIYENNVNRIVEMEHILKILSMDRVANIVNHIEKKEYELGLYMLDVYNETIIETIKDCISIVVIAPVHLVEKIKEKIPEKNYVHLKKRYFEQQYYELGVFETRGTENVVAKRI